ncbi:MAG: Uma2 family endonuclease [Syntrophobacteraceae bacterium]|nr:Uma2 family endonuclease [Syntrophobacteraceae bacterium]
MSHTASKKADYEDLFTIPDNMIGEIVNGKLIATPRPSSRHSHVAAVLSGKLIPPYRLGEGGGPGGWILLYEPEIMLGEHLLVPDLAGWKKERFPRTTQSNWISISPDWVRELLSPGTARYDRIEKMAIYALQGVLHAWLIDPNLKTVEVFELDSSNRWVNRTAFTKKGKIRAAPFEQVEIDLDYLWLEEETGEAT